MTEMLLFLLFVAFGLGVLLKKALANPEVTERAARGVWNHLRK